MSLLKNMFGLGSGRPTTARPTTVSGNSLLGEWSLGRGYDLAHGGEAVGAIAFERRVSGTQHALTPKPAYFYGRDKRLGRATLAAMMQTTDLRERDDLA